MEGKLEEAYEIMDKFNLIKSNSIINYYELFNINKNDINDIVKKIKKMKILFHDDNKNTYLNIVKSNKEEFLQIYGEIQRCVLNADDILTNPEKKAEYDRNLEEEKEKNIMLKYYSNINNNTKSDIYRNETQTYQDNTPKKDNLTDRKKADLFFEEVYRKTNSLRYVVDIIKMMYSSTPNFDFIKNKDVREMVVNLINNKDEFSSFRRTVKSVRTKGITMPDNPKPIDYANNYLVRLYYIDNSFVEEALDEYIESVVISMAYSGKRKTHKAIENYCKNNDDSMFANEEVRDRITSFSKNDMYYILPNLYMCLETEKIARGRNWSFTKNKGNFSNFIDNIYVFEDEDIYRYKRKIERSEMRK